MAQQTYNLPYRETPYQVTATRKFYHPQTKTVSINPTTPNPSLSFELVRKTGEWIYTEDSEVLPYGRTVVEDINVEPEDSYISEPGIDGLREFSEEREWIDGEWTGEVRNVSETITQPVNEIYIQGTAVVTYEIDVKRTEVIPFTVVEYETDEYYEDEVVVTQQGVDGIRSFFASQKYINGIPTGIFTGAETPQVTTQPITHRIAIGTKPNEVTVTVYPNIPVQPGSNGITVNRSTDIEGKVIVKLEMDGMVGEGSWTAREYFTNTRIDVGERFDVIFNSSFTTYPIGTPIHVTYIP